LLIANTSLDFVNYFNAFSDFALTIYNFTLVEHDSDTIIWFQSSTTNVGSLTASEIPVVVERKYDIHVIVEVHFSTDSIAKTYDVTSADGRLETITFVSPASLDVIELELIKASASLNTFKVSVTAFGPDYSQPFVYKYELVEYTGFSDIDNTRWSYLLENTNKSEIFFDVTTTRSFFLIITVSNMFRSFVSCTSTIKLSYSYSTGISTAMLTTALSVNMTQANQESFLSGSNYTSTFYIIYTYK